jgi:hypothetical protein
MSLQPRERGRLRALLSNVSTPPQERARAAEALAADDAERHDSQGPNREAMKRGRDRASNDNRRRRAIR